MLAEAIRPPNAAALPIAPLFDPAYKADPYPYYREWTRQPPFWASVAGQPAVVAARYADVAAIYLDHARFSSVKPPDMARFDFFNGLKDMTHTDPPDHGRLRRTVNPTFAPGSIAWLEGGVQRLIDGQIAPIRASGAPFDLMEALARPLSLDVLLGLLLRVPREDYPIFQAITEAMALLGETTADGCKPEAYLVAWATGEAYCRRVIATQDRHPTDDVIGGVVRAFRAGTLSEPEVLVMVMVINLFVGGLSTIATLIGNASVQILSHPDQHALLKANPDRAGDATDEVLRFDSPGSFNYEFAACDMLFKGLSIPRGTTDYLIHQATGFDPNVFSDAERFDIGRRARNHLSFGYGAHFCIGAHLARLVTRLVLASAMRELPLLSPDRPGRCAMAAGSRNALRWRYGSRRRSDRLTLDRRRWKPQG